MTKILHITGALSGGGAERQLHLLLKNLHDFQHFVFSLNGDGQEGYDDLSTPVTYRKGRSGQRELYRLLVKVQPEIVHCWIPATLPYAIPAVYVYGRQKVVFVAAMRSAYVLRGRRRRLQRWLYDRVDRIVSNVPPLTMNPPYRQVYEEKSGVFIPNGLELSTSSHKLINVENDLIADRRTLLYVGRLIPDKNLFVLLSAVARLPDTTLVICGEGGLEDALHTKCSDLGISSRVHFMGYRKDVRSLMSVARALVLPSTREGMPNVAFEAVAMGCRLVLSDLPVHRFWFDEFAWAQFAPVNDPNAFAKAIAKALLDNGGKPDASMLLAKLRPTTFAANYSRFYNSILSTHQ